MKSASAILRSGSAIGLAVLLVAGCGKNEAPEPVAIEEVPKTIESSFSKAAPAEKQAASQAVAALKANDPGQAFFTLQELSTRSGLTAEQRAAAAESLIAVSQQLNEAAARGDKRAEQALERHRATK